MLFLNPIERLQYHDGDDVKRFLKEIQVYQERGYYVAGWIGYEFGCLLENSLEHQLCREEDRGALLADFGIFASPHIFDHTTGEHDFPFTEKQFIPNGYKLEGLCPSLDREEYLKAISKILEYISAGDTYQVNYTLKLLFDFIGSPELFYRDLRRNQSVSYGAYIRWGNERVLPPSPELLFRKNGQKIMVRPMKGTLQRGRTLS
ncbi:MAG: aminodeoxychorismate synthase, component I, partial [Bacteroidetes bacterium]|nr:aminodeoxychorismate synthase, component I [Bacteroidota bacterium]